MHESYSTVHDAVQLIFLRHFLYFQSDWIQIFGININLEDEFCEQILSKSVNKQKFPHNLIVILHRFLLWTSIDVGLQFFFTTELYGETFYLLTDLDEFILCKYKKKWIQWEWK